MRILICKPSSLGDVVQAMAVLRHIKRYIPESEIYWWVSTAFAPLLKHDPDIAGIFLFDKKSLCQLRDLPKHIRQIRTIRKMRFDVVLDLQSLLRSAVFAWLCKGQRTIGLDDRRELAPIFSDVAIPRPTPQTHAVDWYFETLRGLGIPVKETDIEYIQRSWLPKQEEIAERLAKRFKAFTKEGGRKIAIQPCTRWSSKQYPVDSFVLVIRALLEKLPEAEFFVMGSAADAPVGKHIQELVNNTRLHSLCGKLTLPEMVECIRMMDTMITGDTGPMHVAAALGKPTVALFGPTNPHRTGPYRQVENVIGTRLPCAGCLQKRCPYSREVPPCMQEISIEDVVKKTLSILSK